MTHETLETKVAALEQKGKSDDDRCNARHASDHTRMDKLETALWGENRDGEGGVVNKLNNTILKVGLLTALTSFAGSAIGMVLIQYIAKKAGGQ